MKIHLKNLGSIKKLDFELRRGLTLFCGPNSTGKTYAAYAVYSVLKNIGRWKREWLSAEQFAVLKEKGELRIDLPNMINNPDSLAQLSDELSNSIGRDFAAPQNFFTDDCINIEDLPTSLLNNAINFVSSGFLGSISTKSNGTFVSLANPATIEDLQIDSVNRSISHTYAFCNLVNPIVLTAERAAIQLFSSEILASRSGLITDMLALEDRGESPSLMGKAKQYSRPINDSLADAAWISKYAREFGVYATFANELEQSILGGEVKIGANGQVNFMQTGGKPALRIEMSASIIKSLASLVFYLRHQSRQGDLLIIDEPELNLHPANQRKLARFLCELSNAGLDIIISTHSDYIIREVNNLILLNKPSLAGVKQRHGYRDAELIQPENVSLVMFNPEGYPEQIKVGPDGFTVQSIDDEIAQMNKIANEIMLESEE